MLHLTLGDLESPISPGQWLMYVIEVGNPLSSFLLQGRRRLNFSGVKNEFCQ